MAIYRFRVSFEDYDDVIREIDIKSTQTFEELHIAIHKSTGYSPAKSSSFYVSTDQWIKGEEIAYLPTQRKLDRGVIKMEGTKLNRFIDDPHQKFYYTYNFDRPFDFHVELIKILDLVPGKEYPSLFKSAGEAPRPAGTLVTPSGAAEEPEDFDFLNEMEYAPEDADDLEHVDSLEIDQPEDEEEKDEFMDGFSDNDGFDAEDFDNNNNEDY